MQVTVKLKHLRVTARKVREVVDLIRGKTVVDAKVLLSFTTRKSAAPILKLLNSATASAKHNFQINEENLYVSKTMVDEGPTLKRWHAMSRGRAYPIMKRSAHVTIVLNEINPKSDGEAEKKRTMVKVRKVQKGTSSSKALRVKSKNQNYALKSKTKSKKQKRKTNKF